MAENFDSLTIQITADAKKALDAVNNLAKALERLNTALGGVNAGGLENVSKATDGLAESISKINTRKMKDVAKSISSVSHAGGDVSQAASATNTFANSLNDASDAAKNVTQNVGNKGTSGFLNFKNILSGISGVAKNAYSGFMKFGGALAGILPHANKAAHGMKKISSSSKTAVVSAKSIVGELTRISKMMKLMITRMILRKVITGVVDGFKNLAQYSKTFDASVSLLWNSFRQLGNSIAAAVSPLLNAFAPALNYLIQLVIQAVNAINQLLSALVGLGTWTKAKTLTDDYAKSLDKAGSKAKELKKTVLGFDELNQLQDKNNKGGGGTSPANMFESAEVDDKWKKLADKIKKYWQKLVDPIKKAWARAGDFVKSSWEYAAKAVAKLFKDIADDFLEVWNQPKTVKMLEHLLHAVGNIGKFVGNIAMAFDRAWNEADRGLHIFEKMRDLADIIIKGIEQITESWAKWAIDVDFSAVLESVDKFLEALKKPTKFIMDTLNDFNEDFLQPLTKWLIEKGVPELIDTFTELTNNVDWDKLKERLDKIYKALERFSETFGEGLIQFIGDIGEELVSFANSDNWDAFIDTLIKWTENVDADTVATGLRVIFDALVLYEGLTILGTLAGVFSKLAPAVTALGNAFSNLGSALSTFAASVMAGGLGLYFAAVIDVILGAALVVKSFIQQVKEGIDFFNVGLSEIGWTFLTIITHFNPAVAALLQALLSLVVRYKDNILSVVSGLWNTITGGSTTFTDKIKQIFYDFVAVIQNFFTYKFTELWESIKKLAADIWDVATDLYDKFVSIFDSDKWTFDGVAQGLKDTFQSAKDAIKDIWNSIADALNGSFTIGSHTFDIGLPKIYASGGFPEDGLFMANHGELVGKFSNGRTAVANNEQITEGIARAVYAAMVSAGGSGGNARYINNTIQIDGRTIARAVTQGQTDLNRRYSPTTV